ncbi:AAA family ATPase [Chitinophaga nivalis]|uniref:AAA family ATPase n=1 Tax=Chitinophaga nivalis TaxID=2991709 RepID=A0ABT3IQ21_9BACT|nr:AAA family ATPase [Chitinophaga nivalis]MCW3464465.1 AAA family ATPase [Chitinophaga nivalis]MCW3485844.1 AAA family ATPase [Chitinophaga nivalis]
MKVRSITIPDLHHFKDLHLDLTYPAGHPKAGQALDKVCIIGQSGTGKTTLLKLISVLSYRGSLYKELGSMDQISQISLGFEFEDLIASQTIAFDDEADPEKKMVAYYWNVAYQDDAAIELERANLQWDTYIKSIKQTSIYFPADLDYKLEVEHDDLLNLQDQKNIDFSSYSAANTWTIILNEIRRYQEEEIKIRQEISHIAEKAIDLKSIQNAVKKLEKWRRETRSPVQDIADKCLDPLLKNFGLRVKTKLDFQGKDDIGFLKIEDFAGNEVPNGLLSTGTKQVMLSALPLYLLQPEKCQILYDEPERSLYPDLQRTIIDYYQSLTTDCQFFFATHSPIIASSFEPWEIVELKFDKNWNIYRDLYYEGENHVDNYFVDPRYLDYDLILKKVFDLKDTSTDLRMEALVELTMLKNQLDQLKQDGKLKTPKAKEILTRYKLLAQKLAWKTE